MAQVGLSKQAHGGKVVGRISLGCTLLLLVGCAQTPPKLSISSGGPGMPSQSTAPPPVPAAEKAAAEKLAVKSALLARAEAEPRDVGRTIAAARALKSDGRIADALQLVERSVAVNEKDPQINREAGLLALDLGQSAKAEKLLRRALELGSTEWQTRSAFGAALAMQGKHSDAQLQLAKALELMPDHPAILNNLALSYVLDNKPSEAEKVLRIAASKTAAPRHVQHNLALVLGIRGKAAEAERVTVAASTPAKATGNVAYLKSLAANRASLESEAAEAVAAPTSVKAAQAWTMPEKPFMLGLGRGEERP